jgi:lipopolysaccharide transport system permease protein
MAVAPELEANGTADWKGAGLIFVCGPDAASTRGVLRALDQSGVGVTRLQPGLVPLLATLTGQLGALYLDSRELGGAPGGASENERARLAIESSSRATSEARRMAADLIAHSRAVHDRAVVAEPIHRLPPHVQTLATVVPDARFVVVLPDPRRRRPGDPGADAPAVGAAEAWIDFVQAADSLHERLGDAQVLTLRSDELANPAGVEQVCAFLGMEVSPQVTNALVPAPTEPRPVDEIAEVDDRAAAQLQRWGFGAANDAVDAPVPAPTAEADLVAPEPVSVWRPQDRHDLGYLAVWRHVGDTLVRRRELVWQLFKRDFLATFRKSFLGLSWLLIGPLLGIVQWLVIQRNGLLATAESSVPYPLFVLIGTTMWGLFLGLYTATKSSLSSAGPLLLQLRFPAEALVIQKMGQQLATFAAGFGIIFIALAFYGIAPAWQTVLVPFALIPLTLFATGIGLIVAMVSVVAVDIDRVLTVFWALVLWLTPVVYARKDVDGLLGTIVEWNPMTYLVTAPRALILGDGVGHVAGFAASSLLALVIFLVATRLFHVSQPQLVERLV